MARIAHLETFCFFSAPPYLISFPLSRSWADFSRWLWLCGVAQSKTSSQVLISAKRSTVSRVVEVGRPLLSLNCHNRVAGVTSSRVLFLRSHSWEIDGRGTTLGCGNRTSPTGVLLLTAAAPPVCESLIRWSRLKLSQYFYFFFFIAGSDALLCSAGWGTAETHKKGKILTTRNTKAEDFQTWSDFKNVEDIRREDYSNLFELKSRLH